jgi:hypothetical protein
MNILALLFAGMFARQTASDVSIPGKLVKGHCWEYAVALDKRFTQIGIKSRIIIFDWAFPGRADTHAFVDFKTGGYRWVVDNLHAHPVSVPVNASTMDEINAIEDGNGRHFTNKIESE